MCVPCTSAAVLWDQALVRSSPALFVDSLRGLKQSGRWLAGQLAASAGVSHLLAPELSRERSRPLGRFGASVEFGKMDANRRL